VYTLWRYSLADNSTTLISLDPPIIERYFEVSPDGNWILYYGNPYDSYLGNLANGNTKFFTHLLTQMGFSWSPDSQHFMLAGGTVASFDKMFYSRLEANSWIDANHFSIRNAVPFPPVTQVAEKVTGYEHFHNIIGEINGDEIYFFESEVVVSDLILIRPKR
jgi:hypothetical protein